MSKKTTIIIASALAIAFVISLIMYNFMITSVDSTEYVIKQAVRTGTLTAKTEPGWMFRNFGDISKYNRTEMLYFSDRKEDIDDLDEQEYVGPQIATFTGNSTANIYAFINVQLPSDQESLIKIHRDWTGRYSVKMNMLRNAFSVAIKFAGSMYAPEEAFVDRRSEFQTLVREVLEQGEFATYTETMKLESDSTQTIKKVQFKLDKDGNRTVIKPSILRDYNVKVLQLDVKDFVWDEKTAALIAEKKEAEQKRVAARSQAERAVQDALTAKAEGDARIAKEKADKEVEKISEVTKAEKERDVSRLALETAKLDAEALLTKERSVADANALRVKAGLTPQERAEIDKETAIGVAAELAKMKWPDGWVVVGGGQAGGGKVDPFSAVGLQSFIQMSRDLTNTYKSK